jgi:hypothetical protein
LHKIYFLLLLQKGIQQKQEVHRSTRFPIGYFNLNENVFLIDLSFEAPVKSTVVDFLRMIFEKKTKCVVMLCNFHEGNPSLVTILDSKLIKFDELTKLI